MTHDRVYICEQIDTNWRDTKGEMEFCGEKKFEKNDEGLKKKKKKEIRDGINIHEEEYERLIRFNELN